MNDAHAALFRRIETAFAQVPRPTKVTKRVARAYDDEHVLTEERREFLYAQDTEQHWKDLSEEDLTTYSDIAFFLDPEASLFYLPAFMSYDLVSDPPFGYSTRVEEIFSSCPEQLTLFNEEQLQCVADFVAHAQRGTHEMHVHLDAMSNALDNTSLPSDRASIMRSSLKAWLARKSHIDDKE